MKKIAAISAILTALLASLVCAQRSEPSEFRKQHKYTFQLVQFTFQIEQLEKDSKHALTPAQAKQVLTVLKPLRTKPKLTEDQAKHALKSLKSFLTVGQLNAMSKTKSFNKRPSGRSFGPGGPGGEGSPGRPNGIGAPPKSGDAKNNPPRFDTKAMKDHNPFYVKVDKKDPGSVDRAKRWNSFFSAIEKKAAGKTYSKAPAKPTKRK